MFENKSNRMFHDVNMQWRKYHYADGTVYKIAKPRHLHVSSSGHYICDSTGIMHYIPYGWIAITWVKELHYPDISIDQGALCKTT